MQGTVYTLRKGTELREEIEEALFQMDHNAACEGYGEWLINLGELEDPDGSKAVCLPLMLWYEPTGEDNIIGKVMHLQRGPWGRVIDMSEVPEDVEREEYIAKVIEDEYYSTLPGDLEDAVQYWRRRA